MVSVFAFPIPKSMFLVNFDDHPRPPETVNEGQHAPRRRARRTGRRVATRFIGPLASIVGIVGMWVSVLQLQIFELFLGEMLRFAGPRGGVVQERTHLHHTQIHDTHTHTHSLTRTHTHDSDGSIAVKVSAKNGTDPLNARERNPRQILPRASVGSVAKTQLNNNRRRCLFPPLRALARARTTDADTHTHTWIEMRARGLCGNPYERQQRPVIGCLQHDVFAFVCMCVYLRTAKDTGPRGKARYFVCA